MEGQPLARAKPRRLRPAECRRGRPQRPQIPFRFLDFSMLCRQENFPPAIFGASRPVDGAAADFGARPGASVEGVAAGGRDSFPVSRFINALQAGKFPCRATMRIFFGTPEPPFVSRRSARPAARPCTTSCGFEASETIPFPDPDSIFSSGCGAISGQLRPPLAMRPVSERGALLPSAGELALREAARAIEFGHRRDPHGDGTKSSRNRGLVGERAARNGQSQNGRAWAGSEPRTTIGYDNMNFVFRKTKF